MTRSAPLTFDVPQLLGPALARDRLLQVVLKAEAPIVLLSAAAGMGKSTLLRQIAARTGAPLCHGRSPAAISQEVGLALWDIPPGARPLPLPERFVDGRGTLVVAKRPDVALPGLKRALAYGRVLVVEDGELLFDHEELAIAVGDQRARALIETTAGWPAIVAATLTPGRSPHEAATFCLQAMFAGADEDALVAADFALSKIDQDRESSPPFWVPSAFRPIAKAVAREEIDRRSSVAGAARRMAAAFLRRGQAPDAIRVLQGAGLETEALAAFSEAGGWAFLFRFGPEAFDAALAGFTSPQREHAEPLVLARSFQALKQGDIARARHIIAEKFGAAAIDPARVFRPNSPFSVAMRCYYFLLLPYEGFAPSTELLQRAYATLAEVPTDSHLARGSFHNAALEYFVRDNRFAEAEDLAQRAQFHYQRAGVPILGFYISVHLTVIRLNMGDAVTARGHCEAARAWLADVPYASPNDSRIFALLDACVQYEGGQAEPLLLFLSRDVDRFSIGETWPSLLDLMLQYGAQALGEHYSSHAALAFLNRWRLHEISSRTLRLAIELRVAAILQNANRWDEASEALIAASTHLSRAQILSGAVDLARIGERDLILCALGWMRQTAFHEPKTRGLEQRLTTLRDNLALSPRQRIGVEIWLAYVQRMNRDFGSARATLRRLLEAAARTGALGPIASERAFVSDLVAQRQILEYVETSPQARQALRKLQDVGFGITPNTARLRLTRQETKLLLMACRGATNKDAAKSLGLSEATVKFHLGNAYRKLGCRRRSEATAAAHALGLIR